MKKLLLGSALTILLASCGGEETVTAKTPTSNKSVDKTESSATYKVDVAASTLKWKGSKLGTDHVGTVSLSGGEVVVDNGNIVGGTAEIDMNSIVDEDLSGEWKDTLEVHLKGLNFFNSAAFPTASVKVTEIVNGTAKADLTIKDKTKSIEFPVTSKVEGGSLTLAANFSINRTDWGIVYGSGSFFDIAKDKAIGDDINFDLNLVASK